MREFVAEHFQGHSVLKADRNHSAETLHQPGDCGALLRHANENFPGLSIGIEADRQIAFVAADREVMRDGRALIGKTVPVRLRWTQ